MFQMMCFQKVSNLDTITTIVRMKTGMILEYAVKCLFAARWVIKTFLDRNIHHFKGGKYKSCEEIFEEEYADEYSDSENAISGSNGAGIKRWYGL